MKWLIFIVPLFISAALFAQIPDDNDANENIENKIENIAEQADAELDYSMLTEALQYFYRHPINLNNTDYDELSDLGLLTDIQIRHLLQHIEKNGKLLSLYELQSIEGFDLQTISMILPFVRISNNNERKSWDFKDVMENSKSQWFTRFTTVLQQEKGYSDISDSALAESPSSRYLGSGCKLYTRYKFSYYNLLSVGITGEKDYGEQFFAGNQKSGFDYYSAHFYIRNLGPIKVLALGDYHLQFGQGLTMWTGLAFGKSAQAVGIKKNARGIRPYTSVDENLFMRGAACMFSVKDFDIYAFGSYKKLDANINGDSTDGEEFIISSLTESGLHNTASTVIDKDIMTELVTGGRIEYNRSKFKFGITGVYTRFGQDIPPRDQLYELYYFSGRENINLGLDYSYIWRNSNIFGELARSQNGGMASIIGLMTSPDRFLTFSVLHRYLSKDYQVFYAAAFQESSRPQNEHGLFMGGEVKFSRKWSATGYVDLFSFPWLRYRVGAPSSGVEMLAQGNYHPTKHSHIYVKFKQENKEINGGDGYFDALQPTIKRNYRIHASYPISETVTLKTRAEYMTYNDGDEPQRDGFLIYQDISYRKNGSPFTFSARYALFDTDTYDERLYAYENDVLYSFSIPAYYYKGSRYYLLVRLNAARNLDFWVRIAHTNFSDRDVISSGLNEIQGSGKTELKIQMRLKF